MSSINVTLIIEKKERNIISVEELKQVLIHVGLQQSFSKGFGAIYRGSPFKGPVYFNNKKIQLKLSEALGEGEGCFKLFTESMEDYFKRNQVKEQVKEYFDYIIKSSDSANSTTIFLSENIFSERVSKEIQGGFTSIFDDAEVLKISWKLSHPHIRFLLRNSIENMKELHEIVMNYYKLYGGHVLTFLLSLPPIKFADNKVLQIKNYKTGPLLIPTIKIHTSSGQAAELTICFYPPLKRKGSTKSVATIFDNKKESIGEISEKGQIITKNKTHTYKLTLFAKKINRDKMSFFSGNEFGKCNYCSQPLNHPISIKWGYGEDCATRLDLPYD